MFQKLNLKLEKLDISKLQGHCIEEYGDTYKGFEIKDKIYLNSICINKLKFHIPPSHVHLAVISHDGAGPHTDPSKVSLNYYLNSDNAVTSFYQAKSEYENFKDIQTIILPNGNKREFYYYDLSHVTYVSSFKSEKDTAYLLHTHSIHLVKKSNPYIDRVFLKWLWLDNDFEEVLNSIEIL